MGTDTVIIIQQNQGIICIQLQLHFELVEELSSSLSLIEIVGLVWSLQIKLDQLFSGFLNWKDSMIV